MSDDGMKNAGKDGKELVVFEGGSSPGTHKKPSTWKCEDYFYPPDYWVDTCGLPNDGVLPGKLTDEQVNKKQLDQCFGQRHGPNGRHGFKVKDCKGISKEDILALTQVLDGHDSPVNGFLGINLAKGLYWDLVAGQNVNWAGFAADKHKAQIMNAHKRKEPVPTGPPVTRKERRYKRRPPSVAETEPECQVLTKEAICASNAPSPSPSRGPGNALHDAAREALASKLFGSPPKPFSISGINQPDGASGGDLGALSSEEYEQSSTILAALGDLIATQIEALGGNILSWEKQVNDLEEKCRAEEDLFREYQTKREDLTAAAMTIQKEVNDEETHQSREVRAYNAVLEQYNTDCDFASAEEEDPETVLSLEKQEADIKMFVENLGNFREVLREKTTRLDRNEKERQEVESILVAHANAMNVIRDKITNLEDAIGAEKSKLVFCEEKRRVASVGGRAVNSLKPVAIPYPVEVWKALFRILSCAKCTLAYQCNNFVPTSCGHSYHPACIVQQLSIEGNEPPRCVACKEIFHPDWLESWGFCHAAPEVKQLASELCVPLHHEGFANDLKTLYVDGCHLLRQHRLEERQKQQRLTCFYTKGEEDTECTYGAAKLKARLVRLSTVVPKVGPGVGAVDCVDLDTTELGAEHGSTTGAHLSHMSRTRSAQLLVSVAELATSDSSPSNAGNLVLKELRKVSTPISSMGVQTRSAAEASPTELLQPKLEKSESKGKPGRPKRAKDGSQSAKRIKLIL